MSVATVVTSVLGVKGWKTLNSIHEVASEAKKPLKAVNDIADNIRELFTSDKIKTPNKNKKSEENKDEKKITVSNTNVITESNKNGGTNGVKGVFGKLRDMIKEEIDNYRKQSRNVIVGKDEYPGYFSEGEINDEKCSEKKVEMSPIEYAMYKLNSVLNEISAPAVDSNGEIIKNDGKNVTKVGYIMDLFVNMVENITGTFNNGNMKEALCNYEQELNSYKKGNKIISDMKEFARKYRTNNSEKLYDEEAYKSLLCEYASILAIIQKLRNGEKRSGFIRFTSTDDSITDEEVRIINKYDDCRQTFEIYRSKSEPTEKAVCAGELVAQLNKILINEKKEIDNMRLISQCENVEGLSTDDNIDNNYDILMQAVISNWTYSTYFERYGLNNTPIASLIFQVMMTISKVSNAMVNISIGDIITVLSGAIRGK